MIECLSSMPAGADLEVYHNEFSLFHQWTAPNGGLIVFSASAQGEALNCHFGAQKSALRYLKKAIGEYIDWLCEQYKWCTMILAVVEKPSVARLVEKMGFERLGKTDTDQKLYYWRCKEWAA